MKLFLLVILNFFFTLSAIAQINAPNQLVPHSAIYSNVTSGRFQKKTTGTLPNDNQCVTTSEVKTLVWLQESYLPATANQLPTWQQLVPYFANTMQTQTFQKTCAAGYTGSYVIDTIPAGTYVDSTLANANAKALADLAANGQNNANNKGTCTTTCVGVDKKMINGVCETAVRTCVQSLTVTATKYQNTYHYTWSDGSISDDFTVTESQPCIMQ
ncbi:hypothetical protein DCC81_20850 [Chitinophaga parva]|uniref:DUF5977 domain-containing protein n=1 Tax=Chitinophaga parva TaxID=2169414 RepID=A0A2T7BCR8_9BACT|nr:DUF5977 domain-containing protein [Chitinophaga parva]PUZ22872.1 hypothetical protein DCC81_20850 [Chitinophaga parva]